VRKYNYQKLEKEKRTIRFLTSCRIQYSLDFQLGVYLILVTHNEKHCSCMMVLQNMEGIFVSFLGSLNLEIFGNLLRPILLI
jgi:hypothetical protein